MPQQGIGIHCRVPPSSAGNDDDGRPIEFDVFISHAYEDKDTFVRPLAEALIARNLRPWYDEFTLRPGDSLRRSIDHGLLTSQAGVVVLSPAFFGKRWTNYELDGLVQLAAGDPNQVAGAGSGGRLILSGTKSTQTTSLATALHSRTWWHYKVAMAWRLSLSAFELPCGLRPALLFAHAELTELCAPLNWHPPVVTDDWWLDGIEAGAKIEGEGGLRGGHALGSLGIPFARAQH